MIAAVGTAPLLAIPPLAQHGLNTALRVYALAALLILHAAFRGLYADLDAVIYSAWYTELGTLSGQDFWERLLASGWIFQPREQSLANFELGFSTLAWLLAASGMPTAGFFGVVASLSLLPKAYLALRYASRPSLALLWYACFCYLLLEMNAMRAGLAAALMLMSVPALMGRRWVTYVALVVLAATFHTSALAALALPLLRPLLLRGRRLALLAGASVALTMIDITALFGLLGGAFEKIADYKAALDSGFGDIAYVRLNPVNSSSLPFMVVGLMLCAAAFRRDRQASPQERLGAALYVLPLMALFAFASFPIVGARLSELMSVYQMLFVTALADRYRSFQVGKVLLVVVPLIQLAIQQLFTLHVDVLYFVGHPRPAMTTLIEQKAVIDAVLAEILSRLD